MVKIKLKDCGDGEYTAKIPPVFRGGKDGDWTAIISGDDYGQWNAFLEGGGGIRDERHLSPSPPYARKDYAVRGLNRLMKRLGWPYKVTG